MADREWGLITNGTTFEALVTTLIFFEDSNAALFGRRGVDGGQDARSGDGTRVFQAKHHEDGSAAKAIRDAKKEADKISKHLLPDDSRHEQWKGVTHWRLVTNATFNPTDRQKWDTEVVPLFKAHGLSADYWERANLDALLDKHPEVDRSFFQNETRVLLTLPEIRERLSLDEPFLPRSSPTGFFGRDGETTQIEKFLSSDALFLVIHGPGGIGKTRLLIEASERIAAQGAWQVLGANIASMSLSGAWFEAIVPERPTLLLVDEPEDAQLLNVLSEQLGGRVGRTAKWKVAVTVRSPKDPVLRFLFLPKMKARTQELRVDVLSNRATAEMCYNLLGSGSLNTRTEEWRKNAANELASRFSQHPVWITLAVHVLETHGNLAKVPQTSDGLAAQYLNEIIEAPNPLISREQTLALLRWIALLGTVNRSSDATVKLLVETSKIESEKLILRILSDLVARRALIQRGAESRLVELKPDVLRDHILRHWLSVDVGYGSSPLQPSDDAEMLAKAALAAVSKGSTSAPARSILTALARTERILRLSEQPISLLDSFIKGINSELPNASASVRIATTEVLLDIAAFRPVDTVSISRTLRCSIVEPETIDGLFQTRKIGQDDVVLKLAWLVYHAAMGAETSASRQQVLEELCIVTELEAETGAARGARGLPNDGKRGAQLIGRVLEGGPQFWGDFEEAAVTVSRTLLDQVSSTPPTAGKAAVLKALLEQATEFERSQTWTEGYEIHVQKYTIHPSHPAWHTRKTILKRLTEILEQNTVPLASRIVLWEILATAHRSTNQFFRQAPKNLQTDVHQELLHDLKWSDSVLQKRANNLVELSAARRLWDWHYRFDKDPELKSAAARLEQTYTANHLAREFEPLLNHANWEQRGPLAVSKASELASAGDPAAIDAFLDRAVQFLGSSIELRQLIEVAWHIGNLAPGHEAICAFVRQTLTASANPPRIEFAISILRSWVATLRKGATPSAAFECVVDILKFCGTETLKVLVIHHLYGGSPPPRDVGEITSVEHDYLRTLAPLFLSVGKGPAFIQTVGWAMHYDWLGLKALIENTIAAIPEEQIDSAIGALIDSVYWFVQNDAKSKLYKTPNGFSTWLLDQISKMADIAGAGDMMHWRLNEILNRTGRVSVLWLPAALARRRAMEDREDSNIRAVDGQIFPCQFVEPISEADALDQTTVNALHSLVDLASVTGTIGYYLPEILRHIDPEGLIIPEEVARRLKVVDNDDARRSLARIAGEYPIGSAAWRTIAKPAIDCALQSSARQSIFNQLTDRGVKSWSGTPGEVPALFVAAVESARQLLESENDIAFTPFWEWYLDVAKAELRGQEEQAKEERGE